MSKSRPPGDSVHFGIGSPSLVTASTAVELRNVTKTFPGVLANDDVSISFRKGEVHALLGENGAGKSTLMNILTGIYRPDAGQILVDSNPREFRSATDAIAAGIGMVHQHFKLVQAFTVAENIHLGWKQTPFRLSALDMAQRTVALSRKFGLGLDPQARVADLSAGAQQRVEIVRVLAQGAKVLIVDEPTAVLTPSEAESLFGVLRKLRDDGETVIFISHKLNEVLDIADRVTVLSRGRVVATRDAAGLDTRQLATMMIGREVVFARASGSTAAATREVLRLDGITAYHASGSPALQDVSLTVRSSEILGIAGVAGNGQRSLTEVATGIRKPHAGIVFVDGQPIAGLRPDHIAALGVGHIPEDRLKSGFAGSLPVSSNAVLRRYRMPPVGRGPWFSQAGALRIAREMVAEADVSTPDVDTPLRSLSGGNQQRLIALRECQIATNLLVAAYPMRGLDVGAVSRLRNMILARRDAGAGVLLISEDIDELLDLSDRIAVMAHGRITGILDVADATAERIGLLMGGERLDEAGIHA